MRIGELVIHRGVLRGRREEDRQILVGLQLLRKHLPDKRRMSVLVRTARLRADDRDAVDVPVTEAADAHQHLEVTDVDWSPSPAQIADRACEWAQRWAVRLVACRR